MPQDGATAMLVVVLLLLFGGGGREMCNEAPTLAVA